MEWEHQETFSKLNFVLDNRWKKSNFEDFYQQVYANKFICYSNSSLWTNKQTNKQTNKKTKQQKKKDS